ncbi:unnamed protein product [Closterium sp. NIES-53]
MLMTRGPPQSITLTMATSFTTLTPRLGGSESTAALGASESAAALGASESAAAPDASESAAALGARASPATGPSSAEALHTFTLDSGASRCFFRDCTALTPLAASVPVSLADPTGGPVVVRASTVLPYPTILSGSLSGLHLPTFSTNLVNNAAIQDVWVDTFILGGQRVAICTCSRTGRHLATLQRLDRVGYSPTRIFSSTTASVTPPCLVSATCTPVSLSLAFPGPCPPSRARLPHRAFPASRGGSAPLLIPLSFLRPLLLCNVSGVLIPRIPATRRQLRERFSWDIPVLRLHSDRGGEFYSDLLAEFCRDEGIHQSLTLPASPQKNGIAERRIGLIMEPETSPTLRWTGKVGDASVFRVWGALSLVRDANPNKLSSCTLRCVFLGFPTNAPSWQFYYPRECRVFSSQDITFDESVCF